MLGVWDVDGLLAAMPATALDRWMIWYHAKARGEEAAWLRHGIMCANLLKPHLKPGAQIKPADFIPDFAGKKKQTGQDMRELARRLAEERSEAARQHGTVLQVKESNGESRLNVGPPDGGPAGDGDGI